MAYSSTNPVTLLMDGFASGMPRVFIYQSTHASTDIALLPASTSSSATGVGFFVGAGDGGHGLANAGMRVGDLLVNTNRGSTEFPGITTIHSVIASTANGSTLSSSFGYDVTVSQASL